MQFLGSRKNSLLIILSVFLTLSLAYIYTLSGDVRALKQELSSNKMRYDLELSKLKAQVQICRERRLALIQGRKNSQENYKSYVKEERLSQLTALRLMRSGVYELGLEVERDQDDGGTEKIQFTVYHVKQRLALEGLERDIHVGLAYSGIGKPVYCYLDYNGDGKIDVDIFREMVSYLPMGRLISNAFDLFFAQSIYQKFIAQSNRAHFVADPSIDSKASVISQALWSFVGSEASKFKRLFDESRINQQNL